VREVTKDRSPGGFRSRPPRLGRTLERANPSPAPRRRWHLDPTPPRPRAPTRRSPCGGRSLRRLWPRRRARNGFVLANANLNQTTSAVHRSSSHLGGGGMVLPLTSIASSAPCANVQSCTSDPRLLLPPPLAAPLPKTPLRYTPSPSSTSASVHKPTAVNSRKPTVGYARKPTLILNGSSLPSASPPLSSEPTLPRPPLGLAVELARRARAGISTTWLRCIVTALRRCSPPVSTRLMRTPRSVTIASEDPTAWRRDDDDAPTKQL
jgi:hypothetical protein